MKLPGLDPRRADLIVSGAVLLDTVLQQLEATEITLCDFALREGLVLDYIQRNRKHIAQAGQYPDVRRRSVIELAERCSYWPEHAQPGRAAVAVDLRSDAQRPRADRSRARVARVRGAAARHRHAHQLSAASQALVLPHQERRPARLRAGRSRDHRARRAVSPQVGRRRNRTPTSARSARRSAEAVRTLAAILRFAETLDRSHAQAVTRRRDARPRRGIPRQASHDGRRRARALGRPSSDSAARARVGKADPPERR